MAYLVTNQDGVVSHTPQGQKEPEWEDKGQAEAQAAAANKEAEALGIKTRYEVKEA